LESRQKQIFSALEGKSHQRKEFAYALTNHAANIGIGASIKEETN
jgi:hypothetical protein